MHSHALGANQIFWLQLLRAQKHTHTRMVGWGRWWQLGNIYFPIFPLADFGYTSLEGVRCVKGFE